MGYVLFILVLGITVLLIPFSGEAMRGAADGLKLFACYVLPALFPFFVCSHYLTSGGIFRRLSYRRSFLFLFAAPLTALCGTPSSALIFGRMYSACTMPLKRASVLCAVLNQTGPAFIVSSLCLGMLGGMRYAPAFAVSHYLPAFAAAFFISMAKPAKAAPIVEIPPENPLKNFSEAISGAVVNVLRVGGTIVFFKTVYAVFCAAVPIGNGFFGDFVTGLFEMTTGVSLLSAAPSRLSLSLTAFLVSFGGFCIFIQSKIVFPELSAAPYFTAKLVMGAVSFALFYLICPDPGEAHTVFRSLDEVLEALPSGAGMRLAAFVCTAVSVAFTLAVSLLFSKLAIRKQAA